MARGIDESVQIPVIDISPSNPNASTQLVEAAASYGFVFVKNNEAGIPPGDVDNIFQIVDSHHLFPWYWSHVHAVERSIRSTHRSEGNM
jgi:hypothetical protein